VGKIAEKAVLVDNMALYFECRIKKNRTPTDCFLAILPTGYVSWILQEFNPLSAKPLSEKSVFRLSNF